MTVRSHAATLSSIIWLVIILQHKNISNLSLSHLTTDVRFRAGLHLFNYTSFSLAGI